VNASGLGTLLAATDDWLFWWTEGRLQVTDSGGDVEWRKTFARSFPPSGKTVAVTDDCIVFHRQSTTGRTLVTALDYETGDLAWEVDDGVSDNVSVTAGPSTVYVGSGTRLHAFDAATGARQWSLATGTIQPAPVVTRGTVYVPTSDGVAPLDPASGDRQTSTLLAGQMPNSLAAVEGALYASTNGSVYELGDA
jgi:outer membrane protein assembly factor BamB